jgi:hypothetical protein
MGYVMPYKNCVTLFKCRIKGGAGGATPIDFAPLRHLRHPLIGEGQVAQWRTTSRAHPQHPAAKGRTSPAACRPSARLVTGNYSKHRDRQISRDLANGYGIVPQCLAARRSEGGIDLVRPSTIVTPRKPLDCGAAAHSARDHWQTRILEGRADGNTLRLAVNLVTPALPCASRLAINHGCTPQNPLQDKQTSRQRHLSADQREGVFARDAAASFTLVERKTRTRGANRSTPGETLPCEATIIDIIQEIDRGRGAGRGDSLAVRIIDLSSLVRGAFQKICCRRATPVFGRPVQKIPRGAFRELPACRLPGLWDSPARFVGRSAPGAWSNGKRHQRLAQGACL